MSVLSNSFGKVVMIIVQAELKMAGTRYSTCVTHKCPIKMYMYIRTIANAKSIEILYYAAISEFHSLTLATVEALIAFSKHYNIF